MLFLLKKKKNLLLFGIKPLAMWKKSPNTEKLFIFARKHSLLLLMIKKRKKEKKLQEKYKSDKQRWSEV